MIALLRTLYLLSIAVLGVVFMSAHVLRVWRRARQRRVRREFEAFMRQFHLSDEDALTLIGKERARQLIEEELLARGIDARR